MVSAWRARQVGTPYWTAPEILNHMAYDSKIDVYSFALTLFEPRVGANQSQHETTHPTGTPVVLGCDHVGAGAGQ